MEEELRARLAEVELVVEEERRGRNDANEALVELVAKREELEAALAWERLEWKNRADGLEARLVEKEETIGKLKGELVMQVQILDNSFSALMKISGCFHSGKCGQVASSSATDLHR